ncbi:NAD-dependent epimerase/dehydratase family protein [Halosquirtibacter laminarini]|uniref:NAD-dependent epimerase/dehydratase family protein n=1 Tax=Halosquirtibacter laminarini TaxID=3374600 RepID=A0AC61NL14_9BACT|nr:NAD-dependent epimerase/dehydratase family protein [Prolixibacteraceae bacterium]
MKQHTIAISGARGFVGSKLSEFLQERHTIVILERETILNDPEQLDQILSDVSVVIHLSGASIAQRWTNRYKRVLENSRWITTQNLRAAINRVAKSQNREITFISTSAIGIYPANGPSGEHGEFLGGDFLNQLCRKWEHLALYPPNPNVRTIIFRLSLVLDPKQGAFKGISSLARMGIGINLIDGELPYPAIAVEDLVRCYEWAITKKNIRGCYNIAMPENTTQQMMAKALKRRHRLKFNITVPKSILRLVLGESIALINDMPDIITEKWESTGFIFLYPTIGTYIDHH